MSKANEPPITVGPEMHARWLEDPSDKGMIHLSLVLTLDTNSLLDDLARKIHGTKSEVLRRAVGLLKLAVDETDRGNRIGSVGPEQHLETEFLGIKD